MVGYLCQGIQQHLNCKIIQYHDLQLTVANGRNDNMQGWITIPYEIGLTIYQFRTVITKGVSYPTILGNDSIITHNEVLNLIHIRFSY